MEIHTMASSILLAGRWEPSSEDHDVFSASDPLTGQDLKDTFPVSTWKDLERMADAAAGATRALRQVEPERIGRFLERLADLFEGEGDSITQLATRETALPLETRLRGIELPRTTGQLRAAARAARDQSSSSWRQPRIDAEANIRSVLEPLDGAVLVLGPNNFPLAFNAVSGGDFAAAIAAGNAVIAKAHPAHPGTSALLADCALRAIQETGMPEATLQCFFDAGHEDIARLIEHPSIAAVAFTGSERAGLAIKSVVDRVGKICSLEMSSLNPVVVFPELSDEDLDGFADQWSGSILMGSGQFCTKPGIAFVIGDDAQARRITDRMTARLSSSEDPVLLASGLVDALEAGLRLQQDAGAELICGGVRSDSAGFRFAPTLLYTNGTSFLEMPVSFQRELFGPAGLLVSCEDLDQLLLVLGALQGQLTCCLWTGSRPAEPAVYTEVMGHLRPLCGRLLENKMPTGVAVVDAMVHGGPFPATSHPGFTAVGLPESIRRFSARRCYDGMPESSLPTILR